MQPSVGRPSGCLMCQKMQLPQACSLRIVVEPKYDDDVVDLVVAPELLCARWVGQLDRQIVEGVIWSVTPAVVGGERSNRQQGPQP